ncbi:MAG TPA: YihY/virulence factor BrkB family protein [Herpetosiphonaceae bacterium]
MNPKAIFGLLKQTGKEWSEDKVPRLGAALAYYTVFSIAPLLIIAIGIAGLVLDREAATGQIQAQLDGLLGVDAAKAIQEMIQGASKPSSGILATVIGLATLLFGASGVFGQLQDSLNTIWEVAPKPGRGILGTLKDRFLSFTMVLGVGFMLLVSLVISAALAGIGKYFENLGIPTFLFEAINFAVSFGVITLLFAAIYKVLPDVKIQWRDVWIGAAVTALLFTIGKFLIGLYLGRSSVASSYGAVGSLAILLLWVYYSAQILFFGAEFTQVYANAYGSRVVPDKDAVPVTEEARAQQGMPREEDVKAAAAGKPARPRAKAPKQGKRPATAMVVTQEVKKLEKQRYVAALVGFAVALVVGALRGTKGSAASAEPDGSLRASPDPRV